MVLLLIIVSCMIVNAYVLLSFPFDEHLELYLAAERVNVRKQLTVMWQSCSRSCRLTGTSCT